MEWKGPREWAIERDSVKNKKNYAKKWGYHLEIVDMSTKKRYAHEWRESWEKVDTIRNSMKKYPHAEWRVIHASLSMADANLFMSQVLVDRSAHIHYGAFVLSSVAYLQSPLQKHLSQHQ